MTPAVAKAHYNIITVLSFYLCFVAPVPVPEPLLHQVASLILAVALTGWLSLRWFLVPLAYVPAAYFLVSNLRDYGPEKRLLMPVVAVLGIYLIVFLIEKLARPRPPSSRRGTPPPAA
jgi:hypothetical protein